MGDPLSKCVYGGLIFGVFSGYIIIIIIYISNPCVDYDGAFVNSIIFFQGQRSGTLPSNQKIDWRGNSGLHDGDTSHVDLVGGYYVDGSNVKHGLPMAFTITMLSWSIIEHGDLMDDMIDAAKDAVKWGSDYLLKASTETPDTLYVQVGEVDLKNSCWKRPEDMNKSQKVYNVSSKNPGSDVAAETAAGLAAASVLFRQSDPLYSSSLLTAAIKVFDFADRYRGRYSASNSSSFCSSYCTSSGYYDELLWGASWLYLVTRNSSYLKYAEMNVHYLESGTNHFLSWNDKTIGVKMLLAKLFMQDKMSELHVYKDEVDEFFCSLFPGAARYQVQYSPGGLLILRNESNMQYVTSTVFLLLTYSKYLKFAGEHVFCGTRNIEQEDLVQLAQNQINYILGLNPARISYMVGIGDSYPKYIHHRGSSIPSIHEHPNPISCSSGSQYLYSASPNPNILVGAVVGGPNHTDGFDDDRLKFWQTQPATYVNAPLVGALAYFRHYYPRRC